MALIITVLAVFAILVSSEIWWRRRSTQGEFSRKYVHITVGSFVAFWPFFLSWDQIRLLSVAFFVVISLSKTLHIFKAIHSVQRPTWGEVYFALAVGVITLVTQDHWIYMIALLQMSLADGFAALIGTRFGNRSRYYVFGQTKSVIGTLTFLVVSCVLLAIYSRHATGAIFSPHLAVIAVLATIIENVGIQGLDNLLVPLLVGAELNLFR